MKDLLKENFFNINIGKNTHTVNRIAESFFKNENKDYWIEQAREKFVTVVSYLNEINHPVTTESILRTISQLTKEELDSITKKYKLTDSCTEALKKHTETPENTRSAINEIIRQAILPESNTNEIINYLEERLHSAKAYIKHLEERVVKAESSSIELAGALRARGCILLYLGETPLEKWIDEISETFGTEVTGKFHYHIFDLNSDRIPSEVRRTIREKSNLGNNRF